MTGLCECGCGQPTRIPQKTDTERGQKRGVPNRFLHGHWVPRDHPTGPANQNWRGGRSVHRNGYALVLQRDHPRASKGNGYVLEHILIAETALGRALPVGVDVHHVDGGKGNNAPGNLVICQDHAYHMLLHRRAKALAACGNPNAHRCEYCGSYDRQEDITVRRNKDGSYRRARHRSCHNIAEKRRQSRRASVRQECQS